MDRKQIKHEDIERMKQLACDLVKIADKGRRMRMQQKFVREMAQVYGHENATKMLTKVWLLIDAKTKNELRTS